MAQDTHNPESRTTAAEPGPQPDPILNEGRVGAGRKWAVTAVIVAVLLAVMYGITTHRADQRQSEVQITTPNVTTPGQALPGGRTTADAPPRHPRPAHADRRSNARPDGRAA